MDCRDLANELFSTGICKQDDSERFVRLTAMFLRVRTFGDVTLLQKVNSYFVFEGTWCLYLQGKAAQEEQLRESVWV